MCRRSSVVIRKIFRNKTFRNRRDGFCCSSVSCIRLRTFFRFDWGRFLPHSHGDWDRKPSQSSFDRDSNLSYSMNGFSEHRRFDVVNGGFPSLVFRFEHPKHEASATVILSADISLLAQSDNPFFERAHRKALRLAPDGFERDRVAVVHDPFAVLSYSRLTAL